MNKEIEKAVEEAMADSTGSATEKPAEEVPSTTEVKNEPVEQPVETKVLEQVNNLNTALKQERETTKSFKSEIEELKAKLEESNSITDKLKDVFVEPQPEPEVESSTLTLEQVEALLESRDSKREEELQKEKETTALQTEVKEMENKWNGENGMPKYDDEEVLKWQDENSKMHLSPKEAFNEMNRDAIIDYEIKKRLNKQPEVKNVETPGVSTTEQNPTEKKLQTDEELRNAVLSAIDDANNN